MNWFKTKRVPDPEYNEILKLEIAVEELKFQLECARSTIKEIEQKTYNSDFVIDWGAMRAFSFERTMSGSQPVSIIGYIIVTNADEYRGNEVVKEWTLHCSDEQHDKLAIEFKTYLNTKAMK